MSAPSFRPAAQLGAAGEPTFDETWQADAFALVEALLDAAVFTPAEWTDALSTAIARAREMGDADLGDTYYLHWAAALESLCTGKGIVTRPVVDARQREWRQAYELTPHGQPVVLAATAGDA